MTGEQLDVLLIEDNEGDARLIQEMLRDATELVQRVDTGAVAMDDVRVHHEPYLEDGLARVEEADVVLLDLGLPDSEGLDSLTAFTDAAADVPVIVLTGLDDQQTGVEAIQAGAQDYLVKDEVTSNLLVRTIHHAIERHHQERERERRNEQLEALNRLNRIGHDVTHAVITSSTRDDLERAVTERLVESDAYRFAWVGEVDGATDSVAVRMAAGVDEAELQPVPLTADGSESGPDPIGETVRSHEVQVLQGAGTDSGSAVLRQEAVGPDYGSVACIPIAYEELLYGTLAIYASSPTGFSAPEVEILSRLGDVIGHAITAIERKDALVSDTVLQLEFRADDVFEGLVALSSQHGGEVHLDDLVQNEGALIGYGRTTDIPPDEFREVVDGTADLEDLRIFSDDESEFEFEVAVMGVQSLVEAVATHGGRLTSATVADGEFRFVVEFPPGGDKRKLVSLVTEQCPSASTHAQRTVDRRDRSLADSHEVFEERLTEKQRTALATAFHAGMFDWPRKTTGEEVAERLGVTPATFSQHLRAAERKFFEAVFAEEEPEEAAATEPSAED